MIPCSPSTCPGSSEYRSAVLFGGTFDGILEERPEPTVRACPHGQLVQMSATAPCTVSIPTFRTHAYSFSFFHPRSRHNIGSRASGSGDTYLVAKCSRCTLAVRGRIGRGGPSIARVDDRRNLSGNQVLDPGLLQLAARHGIVELQLQTPALERQKMWRVEKGAVSSLVLARNGKKPLALSRS